MMLQSWTCPNCGHKISDRSDECPNCLVNYYEAMEYLEERAEADEIGKQLEAAA